MRTYILTVNERLERKTREVYRVSFLIGGDVGAVVYLHDGVASCISIRKVLRDRRRPIEPPHIA